MIPNTTVPAVQNAVQNADPDHVPIQRIIVPLDETLFPERTVPAVVALARAFASEIVLVCACEPYSGLPSGNRALPTAPRASRPTIAEAQERLTRLERVFRAQWPEVSSRLRQCFPPAATVETAMEGSSALIVLRTSLEENNAGQPALPDFAAEVLYQADAPVLLASSATHLPFERDGGRGLRIVISARDLHASKTALDYALLLAQAFGGEIILLHPEERTGSARDGEAVLSEAEWESLQSRCRQQGSGLRTEAHPKTLDPEEAPQDLGELADLLIIANPHAMGAQWRVVADAARLLHAGRTPLLLVP